MEKIKEVHISPHLKENTDYIDDLIGVGKSWDILAKPFSYGNLNLMSYTTNGFFLTMNMVMILENLEKSIGDFIAKHSEEKFQLDELVDFLNTNVSFVQVQSVPKMYDAVRFILSGTLIIFIDGYDQSLLIDTRIYPMRSIAPPMTERLIRGPHDGFTEAMLMNTSMIRRRLRDPRLRVELMQIGSRSQTDVSIMYIDDIVNKDILENIKNRLKSINSDGIIMGEQSVAEWIGRVKWNPYPIVRYTERPDVAATALIEGHIVIVVDNSPEIIIAPITLFQHLQHPQEFHSYPLFGTYMRWIILLSVLGSTLLPGVFLLCNQYPHWIPEWMTFFKAQRSDPLPLWTEILLGELFIDVLRLAVINTPQVLGSAVSILASIVFGQFASSIHLLQPEVMVYIAFVMIMEFATSSYEVAEANQMSRIGLLICTALGRKWGFLIGLIGLFVLLLRTKSFGIPYLWPLIPFRWKNGLVEVILRRPIVDITGRPKVLIPKKQKRKGT
ncbi:spore germination protein [Pullulanibacillus sp. KACC 23026]|uniref:spore germination protein n=1 Tax=Pullulanibacillus sp. KACC 23026 TaxID=3028315 RepID=UPI0023AF9644|nr:spore germination protein [Pullulanibacillus sp. KACC 23026]WEG14853.1 spore germination protein [Pullulanibacillus sp. KACC 23026]